MGRRARGCEEIISLSFLPGVLSKRLKLQYEMGDRTLG